MDDDVTETAKRVAHLHDRDRAFRGVLERVAPRLGAALNLDRAISLRGVAGITLLVAGVTASLVGGHGQRIASAVAVVSLLAIVMASFRIARLRRSLTGSRR